MARSILRWVDDSHMLLDTLHLDAKDDTFLYLVETFDHRSKCPRQCLSTDLREPASPGTMFIRFDLPGVEPVANQVLGPTGTCRGRWSRRSRSEARKGKNDEA